MKRDFSHLPACVEAFACGIWRASDIIIEIACSAVVIELPNGVFITMMPRAVAALMSTLSTPMPARPTTFKLSAGRVSFSVTLVAERIARPSNSPIISASLSLSLPSFGSKVTSMPRSLKICTAVVRQLVGDENLGSSHELEFLFECAGRREDPHSARAGMQAGRLTECR